MLLGLADAVTACASCGACRDERVADPLHGRRIDVEFGRSLAHAQAAITGCQDSLLERGGYPGPAELLPLSLGPPQAGAHPLLDHGAFELGEHAHHLE